VQEFSSKPVLRQVLEGAKRWGDRQFQEQLCFISISAFYVKLKASLQGLQHC